MGYVVPPEGYWRSFVEEERLAVQMGEENDESREEDACDRHYPKPDPFCPACGENRP